MLVGQAEAFNSPEDEEVAVSAGLSFVDPGRVAPEEIGAFVICVERDKRVVAFDVVG